MLIPGLCSAAGDVDAANEHTRQFVRQTMKEQRIPGLQIAIVKDAQIVLSESYGLANVEDRIATSKTTLFPINSATKSFAGVALMQLAEAGLVDLDAPVSRYLDDLPEAWRAVRVRQLLAHTSGLPDIVGAQGLIGGGGEAEAWKAVKALPMDAPIGERFAYNQTNYALLGQIIARQSKMPHERFFAERQFAPAGMHTATFGDGYDLVANAASVYIYSRSRPLAAGDGDRLVHWFDDLPGGLRAGSAMKTTADEIAHWLVALDQGRLISTDNVQRMWTSEKLNSGEDAGWAAGWPVLDTTPGKRQVAGIGGGRSAFVVFPDDGLAVVVLTNLVGSNPQRFIPSIAAFYRTAQKIPAP
ncbi:serine hydrolase domain-containing protein [Tahibacter aquaticus]|uniref:serine hydrolase domain-containing protein n=1 Tax=Tahibacter aquaticus TaxID=520092 RepID=UPI003CE4FB0E